MAEGEQAMEANSIAGFLCELGQTNKTDKDGFMYPRYKKRTIEQTHSEAGTKRYKIPEKREPTAGPSNKNQRTISISPIESKNRYAPLSDDEDNDDVEHESSEDNEPTQNENNGKTAPAKDNKKPPPLVLHMEVTDHKKMVDYVTKFVGTDFHMKYYRNRVAIFPHTLKGHKTLIDNLNPNVQFHTFTTDEQKTRTYVLKGLTRDITHDDVQEELHKTHQITPIRCNQMKNPHSNLIIVTVDSNTDTINKLTSIRYLAHTRVHWEIYKNSKKMTQCHRCQEWGHATSNCRVAPRCLKCAERHLTKDCQKSQELPPKCANCGEEHTANSINCKVYQARLDWLESRKYRAPLTTTRDPQRPPNTSNPRQFPALKPAPLPAFNPWTGGRTAIQRHPPPASNNEGQRLRESESSASGFSELCGEINALNQLIDVNKMLGLVKNLNAQLAHCKTEFEKFQVFNSFCNKLNG